MMNTLDAFAQSHRLPTPKLRWICDPNQFDFETTEELEPAGGIVGQHTAYEALKFGLQCLARGQNVFVRGAMGTGRSKMVYDLLNELRPRTENKRDFCYVQNFSQPDHPRLITLPAGEAPKFRDAMQKLAEFFQSGMLKAMESEPHRTHRQTLQDQLQSQIAEITEPLEADLNADQMALVSSEQGSVPQTMILPVVEGEPVSFEQLQTMVYQGKASQSQIDRFETNFPGYQRRLKETSQRVNEAVRNTTRRLQELTENFVRDLTAEMMQQICQQFPGEKVQIFLNEVVNFAVGYFARRQPSASEPNFSISCGVNIILTHSNLTLRPVVEETTPSLMNLLGTVEPSFGPSGEISTDYRGIRAGALVNADQGYLILDVKDVLEEPGAWRALMRTLRTEQLEIVPREMSWLRQTSVIFPEPIDVKVRVILIGDNETYYMLDYRDSDFSELFKVLADFDDEISRDEDGIKLYAHVLASLCRSESMPHFDRSAVAAITEHGARIASGHRKLTAKFGRIADIAGEAAFLSEGKLVSQKNVRDAIDRTKARASLPSRRFWGMVQNRSIMIQTSGEVVGQINGLAVMRSGPLTYGFPARITASIGPGNAGIIDIEESARLSGSIHTKGFYILGGLLRRLLPTKHPLAFSASLAFEQSYGGIDGDSASGAEMVCLLSALTKIPIRQSLAITGAIDQLGHLQSIGGANEKIEGFFDACHHFGLTGDQGVVIPQANAQDLMLRHDVVQACEAGKFHVFSVDTICDAIELMTGVPAGKIDESGRYPEGSLLAAAHQRAEEYWRLSLASPQSKPAVEPLSEEAAPVEPLSVDPSSGEVDRRE
jgi:predicted ATP-dependent protease